MPRARPSRSPWALLVPLAALLVAGAALALLATSRLTTSRLAAPGAAALTGSGAGHSSGAAKGSGASASHPLGKAATTVPDAFRVVSTSPANGASGVDAFKPLEVDFSAPVSTLGALPQLEPPLAGSWRQMSADVLQFDPSSPAMPQSTEKLVIPGGSAGVMSQQGPVLPTTTTVSWQVASGSVLWAQEVLAQLGYLPLTFTPDATTQAGSAAGAGSSMADLYEPPSGSFTWRYADTPATLKAAWAPGVANRMTRGAIVAFERAQKMIPYTTVRAPLWPALLTAEEDGTTNPHGYSYVMVSENSPESISIWHNGAIVYKSVANTGIASTPTPIGTFFIYLRYASQTMEGYNPNGQYYEDHGVRWINYFDGNDAIHGFVRSSYGFPQSLGCVELPVANAAVAWTWLHYGTLVTVSPPTAT